MNTHKILFTVAAIAALIAGGYGLYSLGVSQGQKASGSAASTVQKAGAVDPATGKKVLYWHDPMVPGQKFDKPGKSPFMDMQLVPVYADGDNDEGKVVISSRVQQNLGIRTAEVTRQNLAVAIEAVGSVAYNERDVALVQARGNGFVERLHVRAPLDPVRKGQPLAELYIPDWVAVQEEYLTARRMRGAGLDALVDAARQRMRLAGMTDEQIRLVEASGKPHARMTVVAPVSGVVAELSAREGMTVMAGAPLFRINGLRTVWVNAEVPENLAMQLRPGNAVAARTPALPGAVFNGKVSAILPEVNTTTRTVKARVELDNPAGQLVPGMFATVNFTPASGKEVLTVPSEAVIQTGKRSVVILAEGDGKFAQRDVDIGAENNGQTEIRKGVEAGQKVVVSGQFLIDSEASLKGTATRMSDSDNEAADRAKAGGEVHRASGKVEAIGKEAITIAHGPVASLKWDAMTMDFKLPAAGLPNNVHKGDMVQFTFRQTKDGEFELSTITPIASDASGMKK